MLLVLILNGKLQNRHLSRSPVPKCGIVPMLEVGWDMTRQSKFIPHTFYLATQLTDTFIFKKEHLREP